MAMAVATLGPKELKLRAQRQAGGNEVARRYGVPVQKISLAQARELFPDGKAALREATVGVREPRPKIDAPTANDLHIRAAARAERAQIRVAELEVELQAAKDLLDTAVAQAGKARVRIGELEQLNSRVAADAKSAYARNGDLETEVSTLKRELAKRGSTGVPTACPVCTARKEANRLSMRKKRAKGE
jgi:hypothetical protein